MNQREISIFEIEQIIKYGIHESDLDEFDKKHNYWRYVIRNRDIEEDPDVVIVTVMQIDPVTARKLEKRKS